MEKRRRFAVTAVVLAMAYYAIALFLTGPTSAFASTAAVGGVLACFAASAGAAWAAVRTSGPSRRGWAAGARGRAAQT